MQLIGCQFFKSREIAGKTEMGREFDLSSLSPSLNIGVTLANFHASGKVLVSIDVLKRIAREFSM